jgi:hypothetical protein
MKRNRHDAQVADTKHNHSESIKLPTAKFWVFVTAALLDHYRKVGSAPAVPSLGSMQRAAISG